MTFLQTIRAAGGRVRAAGASEGGGHRFARLLALAAVGVFAATAYAAPALAANALQKVGFSSLPGGGVQVVLTLAQPAPGREENPTFCSALAASAGAA